MNESNSDCNNDVSIIDELSKAGHFDRRSFLRWGSAAAATAAALEVLPHAVCAELTRETDFILFSSYQQATVQAIQTHLFPSDPDSPGAMDINATEYLQRAITAPGIDPDTRNLVVNGADRFHDASRERFDGHFSALNYQEREILLRYLADKTRWGRAWLSLLMYYILEALLSDPVYGGNPNGIGWHWLNHQAGFPRPPVDKIYGSQ